MVGINITKSKYRFNLDFGTDFLNYDNQSTYLGTVTTLKNNYMYPNVRAYINYKVAKSKSIYSRYTYNVNLPSAEQLLPFENLANPLNTITGNAFLKPVENHNLYMNYFYIHTISFYVGNNRDDNIN